MEWTVLKLLNWTTDYLKKRGVPTPRLDAEVLLADTLGYSRVQLYTNFDQPPTAEELRLYKERITRRADRQPVAHITGKKEFFSLDFAVGPGVLIPRPETELLVEAAISILGRAARPRADRRSLPWSLEPPPEKDPSHEESPEDGADGVSEAPDSPAEEADEKPAPIPIIDVSDNSIAGFLEPEGLCESAGREDFPHSQAEPPVEPPLVLDLCTGSGIIPVCLARECGAKVVGVDISEKALEYARQNVEAHGLSGQIGLLQGNLGEPVPARFLGRFQLLTANPPYITPDEFKSLEPEVNCHEPREALLAPPDGLSYYRQIAKSVPRLVRKGGWVLVEVGNSFQAQAVQEMFTVAGLVNVEILQDLGKMDRVVQGRRPQ